MTRRGAVSSKNNREQKLLLFLSKNQDYVTSDDIAKILNASQKTVYRLIKKLMMNMKAVL